MTGYTPGDNLPYPNDYNAYADVPADMAALANAVQTGLTNRNNPAFVSASLPVNGNFIAGTAAGVVLYHAIVVARGLYTRSSALTLVDNTEYQFATVPAGYRPPVDVTMTGALLAFSGGKTTYTCCQIRVATNGALFFRSNVAGTMRVGGDYISAGGCTWTTV